MPTKSLPSKVKPTHAVRREREAMPLDVLTPRERRIRELAGMAAIECGRMLTLSASADIRIVPAASGIEGRFIAEILRTGKVSTASGFHPGIPSDEVLRAMGRAVASVMARY